MNSKKTEARAAGRGYNIDVLVFGLGGVIIAFVVILLAYTRGFCSSRGAGTIPPRLTFDGC